LEREIFTGGSRDGGKTELGLAWLAEPEYIEHPMFSSLVIRKDYDDLKQWIRRARVFYAGLASISGTPAEIHWNKGGVSYIGHWKDQDTISKYIGRENQKILIEELTQTVRTEEEYQMILGSLRSSVPELRSQLMANANPGGPGHRFAKTYFVDKCMVSKCCEAPIIMQQDTSYVCAACGKPTAKRLRVYVDPHTDSDRVFIPLGYKDNPTAKLNDPEHVRWLEGLGGSLGRAWRDGDWNAFKGQFFSNFGPHLRETAFRLEPHYHAHRVSGSFDYGCGANGVSSFGFWFLDEKNVPHRCFTKTSRGLIPPSDQAEILEEYIASFPLTCGLFPKKIWYDNSMDSRAGLKGDEWATIDYFKAAFDKHGVVWIPANKARVNGWQVVIDYFGTDQKTGLAKMKYWEGYNDDWVNSIPDLVSDPNRPDDVEKCDQDHWMDECRYGLVGLRSSLIGADAEKKRTIRTPEDCQLLLKRLEDMGRISDIGLN
jgi:hypothetical protein